MVGTPRFLQRGPREREGRALRLRRGRNDALGGRDGLRLVGTNEGEHFGGASDERLTLRVWPLPNRDGRERDGQLDRLEDTQLGHRSTEVRRLLRLRMGWRLPRHRHVDAMRLGQRDALPELEQGPLGHLDFSRSRSGQHGGDCLGQLHRTNRSRGRT